MHPRPKPDGPSSPPAGEGGGSSPTPTPAGGILFLRTTDLDRIRQFYTRRLGFRTWLDQGDCLILNRGNLLVGFCLRPGGQPAAEGLLTLFVPDRAGVDRLYADLTETADAPPRWNSRYRIYQFFACDPDGRTLEVQAFEHPIGFDFATGRIVTAGRTKQQSGELSENPEAVEPPPRRPAR